MTPYVPQAGDTVAVHRDNVFHSELLPGILERAPQAVVVRAMPDEPGSYELSDGSIVLAHHLYLVERPTAASASTKAKDK